MFSTRLLFHWSTPIFHDNQRTQQLALQFFLRWIQLNEEEQIHSLTIWPLIIRFTRTIFGSEINEETIASLLHAIENNRQISTILSNLDGIETFLQSKAPDRNSLVLEVLRRSLLVCSEASTLIVLHLLRSLFILHLNDPNQTICQQVSRMAVELVTRLIDEVRPILSFSDSLSECSFRIRWRNIFSANRWPLFKRVFVPWRWKIRLPCGNWSTNWRWTSRDINWPKPRLTTNLFLSRNRCDDELEKTFHSTTKLRSVRIVGDAKVLSTDIGHGIATSEIDRRTGERSALIDPSARTRSVRVRRERTHVSTALTLTLISDQRIDQQRRKQPKQSEHRSNPKYQRTEEEQREREINVHLHQAEGSEDLRRAFLGRETRNK